MPPSSSSPLADLLAAQRPGWTLDQPFYTDPAIFAYERAHWFPRQWMAVAHVSELPRRGSRIVRDLFGSEIVIVNAGEAGLRAFHNVCPHRGSRICTEDGRAPLLVCPYHAWSFQLTGALQSRREVPEGVDPDTLGLRPVALREMGGLILCGLDEAALPDPGPAADALLPALRQHGLHRARIVERRSYATAANWKLVLENFFECYHCRPSHPEYFRMNGHVGSTAVRDPAAAAQWEQDVAAWRTTVGEGAHNATVREAGGLDAMRFSLYRQPIGLGRSTVSREGTPVAPLMGGFTAYDGGETAMHLGRLCFLGAYNDHALLFQFNPRGAEDTDVVATWFVDADADPAAIDVEALTFMWDVTTKQDKRLIEDNAAGVRSRAYRPGPYTTLESQSAAFVADYVAVLRQLADAMPL